MAIIVKAFKLFLMILKENNNEYKSR